MPTMFYDRKDRLQFTAWVKDRAELLLTAALCSIPFVVLEVIGYAAAHFVKKYW